MGSIKLLCEVFTLDGIARRLMLGLITEGKSNNNATWRGGILLSAVTVSTDGAKSQLGK